MAKVKMTNGSEFYRKAGLKPLIIHVSEKTHETLSSIAKLESRSLQLVARALLEQGAKDHKSVLETVSKFVRQLAQSSEK
jgi:BioD-like phosphotransacetylase family protein